MDKNLENKLDEILEKVNKIDQIEKTINGYIDFSNTRMTNIEDNMATKQDIQNLKLDLMDKYADKEKVSDHEARIVTLEDKVLL